MLESFLTGSMDNGPLGQSRVAGLRCLTLRAFRSAALSLDHALAMSCPLQMGVRRLASTLLILCTTLGAGPVLVQPYAQLLGGAVRGCPFSSRGSTRTLLSTQRAILLSRWLLWRPLQMLKQP